MYIRVFPGGCVLLSGTINFTSLLSQPLYYTLGHLNLQVTTSDCILSSPYVTPAFDS